MILDIVPYRSDKNLGKGYNEAMQLLPDGGTAILRDGDTQYLTSDYGTIIEEYVRLFPGAVLTCLTNRISPLSKMQLLKGKPDENSDIRYHIDLAEKQKKHLYSVTEIQRDISGMLMVIPKDVWLQHPFKEGIGCLGVDTEFNRRIRAAGVKILRCDGLYLFHSYRLINGIFSKTHLK